MSNFGLFRGFSEKMFEGELPINLGTKGFINLSPLLLDIYTNAAAAYSLRKLRTDYNGFCIKVRRDNNDELDIGFDLSAELDISALLNFAGAGNAYVTKIYDQSGNNRDALQTILLNQPQIITNGVVITKNGRAAMSGIVNSSLTATTSSINQPYTIFAVTQGDDVAGQRYISDGITDNSSQLAIQSEFVLGIFAGSFISHSSITSLRNVFLSYALFNGVNSQLAVNANNITSGNVGSNNIGTRITLMSSGNLTKGLRGFFQEWVLYNNVQSANRSNISDEINDFYSIY